MKNSSLLLLSIFYSTLAYCQSGVELMTKPSTQERTLDRAVRNIDLTCKLPKKYTQSADEVPLLNSGEPGELLRTVSNITTSLWTHEDNECILFIKCPGEFARLNKSKKEFVIVLFSELGES